MIQGSEFKFPLFSTAHYSFETRNAVSGEWRRGVGVEDSVFCPLGLLPGFYGGWNVLMYMKFSH